jgi:hypothetical protein
MIFASCEGFEKCYISRQWWNKCVRCTCGFSEYFWGIRLEYHQFHRPFSISMHLLISVWHRILPFQTGVFCIFYQNLASNLHFSHRLEDVNVFAKQSSGPKKNRIICSCFHGGETWTLTSNTEYNCVIKISGKRLDLKIFKWVRNTWYIIILLHYKEKLGTSDTFKESTVKIQETTVICAFS